LLPKYSATFLFFPADPTDFQRGFAGGAISLAISGYGFLHDGLLTPRLTYVAPLDRRAGVSIVQFYYAVIGFRSSWQAQHSTTG
jgi:hypothetical protein